MSAAPGKLSAVEVTTIRRIERPEATRLAEAELLRCADALDALDADDWAKPTANHLWDVRAMAGHVLGATEMMTSVRRLFPLMAAGAKRAKAQGIEMIDGLTALQVERFAMDADADLKLFGLEKPEATIIVTLMDGTTRVLAVGGAVGGTGDKQRYARVVDKGRTDVFVLSAADTERFTRDRAVYMQKK